jgi:PAS domain S-box-containing protein
MDITERKTTEEALRRGDKTYKAILQTANDGFWLADLKGRIIEVNDAYCRMSGYNKDELLTMIIPDLEAAMDKAGVAAKIDDVLIKGYDRFETRHLKKNGDVYDVEVGVQHLQVEEGVLVIFIRDITAQKQTEKEKELLQNQLVQAQKMESIGRLAGGVAHDFNNMLGAILGFAEIALWHEGLAEDVKNALEEIRKAAHKSTEITKQMLAFARKQTISPKPLDLNETVNATISMIKRLIGEDIDLAWIPEKDVWPVKMDPAQVDQILVNLCVNARDAIADVGKITIETGNVSFDETYCRHHPSFSPGDFVMVSVSDNGSGMDGETMMNIFEPFFTTKSKDKGTGLGLSTVYGIIKQNKGFINVYSEPDSGTSFKIYMPRFVGDAAVSRQKPHMPQDVLGQETILLVEDNPSILTMTNRLLAHLGYNVLSAGSPSQALDLAREYVGTIHLLMTDVVMPEMNGRDLSHQILTLHPDLKHLFMSGYTANVIAHHGVLDEGVNFIQKPFSRNDLAVKLREVLDRNRD